MAVTAVYEHPTSPGAPSLLQAKEQVTFTLNDVLNADTTIIVTHNMALSAADLAAGLPIVVFEPLRATARGAAGSAWCVGSAALPGIAGKTANAIQLTKTAGAGSNDPGAGVAQIRIHLLRPHSIGR